MSVIAVVLPLALIIAAVALWACVRAIQGGQFDDLDTPPLRALIDDVPVRPAEAEEASDEAADRDAPR